MTKRNTKKVNKRLDRLSSWMGRFLSAGTRSPAGFPREIDEIIPMFVASFKGG